MAKDDVFSDDDELDMDLPDWGMDSDPFSSGGMDEKDGKKREPSFKQLLTSSYSTDDLRGDLKEGSIAALKSQIDRSFPRASEAIGQFQQAATAASTATDETLRQIRPTINKTKKLVRTLWTSTQRFVPEKLYKKVAESLTPDAEETSTKTDDKTNREQMLADAMAQLRDAFSVQNDIAEEKDRRAEAYRLYDNQQNKAQHGDIVNLLSGIQHLNQFQVAFAKGPITTFMQKSIELQYRQLFVQQDILQANKFQIDILKQKLEEISKNTSLPDQDKVLLRERLKHGIANSIQNTFMDAFVNPFIKRAKDKTVDLVNNTLGGLVDSASMMSSGEDLPPEAKMNMLLSTLMQAGIEKAGKIGLNYAEGFLSEDKRKWLDDTIGNAPRKAKQLLTRTLNGTVRFKGGETVQDVLSELAPEVGVENTRNVMNDATDLGSGEIAGAITKRFTTTVEEIIPGYLRKQTQFLEAIATAKAGDALKNTQEQIFDFKRQTFISASTAAKELHKSTFGDERFRAYQIQRNKQAVEDSLITGSDEIKNRYTADPNLGNRVGVCIINLANHGRFTELDTEELKKFIDNQGKYRSDYIDAMFAFDSTTNESANFKVEDALQVAQFLYDAGTIGPNGKVFVEEFQHIVDQMLREQIHFNNNSLQAAKRFAGIKQIEEANDIYEKDENGDIRVTARGQRAINANAVAKQYNVDDAGKLGNTVVSRDQGTRVNERTGKTETLGADGKWHAEKRRTYAGDLAKRTFGFLKDAGVKAITDIFYAIPEEHREQILKLKAMPAEKIDQFIKDVQDKKAFPDLSDRDRERVVENLKIVHGLMSKTSRDNIVGNAVNKGFDWLQQGINKFQQTVEYTDTTAQRHARILGDDTGPEVTATPPETPSPTGPSTTLDGASSGTRVQQQAQTMAEAAAQVSPTTPAATPTEPAPVAPETSATPSPETTGTVGATAPPEASTTAEQGFFSKLVDQFRKDETPSTSSATEENTKLESFVGGLVNRFTEAVHGEKKQENTESETATEDQTKTYQQQQDDEKREEQKVETRQQSFVEKLVSGFKNVFSGNAKQSTESSTASETAEATTSTECVNKGFSGTPDYNSKIEELLAKQLDVQQKTLDLLQKGVIAVDGNVEYEEDGKRKKVKRSKPKESLAAKLALAPWRTAKWGIATGANIAYEGARAAGKIVNPLAKGALRGMGAVGGFMGKTAVNAVGGTAKLLGKVIHPTQMLSSIVHMPTDMLRGAIKQFEDVYVKDRMKDGPIITKQQLEFGSVVTKDGKPVKSVYKIKEPLYWSTDLKAHPENKGREGNVALSADDLPKLCNRFGRPFNNLGSLAGRLLGGTARLTGKAISAAGNIPKLLMDGAIGLAKFAFKKKNPFVDVYGKDKNGNWIVDEEGKKRRLLTWDGIRDGKYKYADGSRVKSAYGINEQVLDENNNVVIDTDQLKRGLYDVNGYLLTKWRGRSIAGKLTIGTLSAAGHVAKGLSSGVLKAGKLAAKDIGKLLGKGISKTVEKTENFADWIVGSTSELLNSIFGGKTGGVVSREVLEDVVGLRLDHLSGQFDKLYEMQYWHLKNIYSLLDTRMPGKKVAGDTDGDGYRNGSYEDYMQKKKEKEEAERAKKAEKKAEQEAKRAADKDKANGAATLNTGDKDEEGSGVWDLVKSGVGWLGGAAATKFAASKLGQKFAATKAGQLFAKTKLGSKIFSRAAETAGAAGAEAAAGAGAKAAAGAAAKKPGFWGKLGSSAWKLLTKTKYGKAALVGGGLLGANALFSDAKADDQVPGASSLTPEQAALLAQSEDAQAPMEGQQPGMPIDQMVPPDVQAPTENQQSSAASLMNQMVPPDVQAQVAAGAAPGATATPSEQQQPEEEEKKDDSGFGMADVGQIALTTKAGSRAAAKGIGGLASAGLKAGGKIMSKAGLKAAGGIAAKLAARTALAACAGPLAPVVAVAGWLWTAYDIYKAVTADSENETEWKHLRGSKYGCEYDEDHNNDALEDMEEFALKQIYGESEGPTDDDFEDFMIDMGLREGAMTRGVNAVKDTLKTIGKGVFNYMTLGLFSGKKGEKEEEPQEDPEAHKLEYIKGWYTNRFQPIYAEYNRVVKAFSEVPTDDPSEPKPDDIDEENLEAAKKAFESRADKILARDKFTAKLAPTPEAYEAWFKETYGPKEEEKKQDEKDKDSVKAIATPGDVTGPAKEAEAAAAAADQAQSETPEESSVTDTVKKLIPKGIASAVKLGAAMVFPGLGLSYLLKHAWSKDPWWTERARGYGVNSDDDDLRNASEDLEELAFPAMANQDFKQWHDWQWVTYAKKFGFIDSGFLGVFGGDSEEEITKRIAFFKSWFNERFYPVFQVYMDTLYEALGDDADRSKIPEPFDLKDEVREQALENFAKAVDQILGRQSVGDLAPTRAAYEGWFKKQQEEQLTPEEKAKKEAEEAKASADLLTGAKDETAKAEQAAAAAREQLNAQMQQAAEQQQQNAGSVDGAVSAPPPATPPAGAGNEVAGDNSGGSSSDTGEQASAVPKARPFTPDAAAKKVWKFFKSKGWTDEGVAALMGNLKKESGIEPVRLQGDMKKGRERSKKYMEDADKSEQTFAPADPKKQIGFGLAQWTTPDRKSNLWNFTHDKGKSVGDLDSQLEYLNKELEGPYRRVTKQIKNSKHLADAARIVLQKFEVARDRNLPSEIEERASLAQGVYNEFSGKPLDDMETDTETTSTPTADSGFGSNAGGDTSGNTQAGGMPGATEPAGGGVTTVPAAGSADTGGSTSAPTSGGSADSSGPQSASGDSPASAGSVDDKGKGSDLEKAAKVQNGVDTKNLSGALRDRFASMAKEFEEKFRRKPTITSGKRSMAQQAALRKKKGSGAAKPSPFSPHISGLALDASSADMNMADRSGLLQKHGLWRPLKNGLGRCPPEAWHVEVAGSRDPNTRVITAETLAKFKQEGKMPSATEGTGDGAVQLDNSGTTTPPTAPTSGAGARSVEAQSDLGTSTDVSKLPPVNSQSPSSGQGSPTNTEAAQAATEAASGNDNVSTSVPANVTDTANSMTGGTGGAEVNTSTPTVIADTPSQTGGVGEHASGEAQLAELKLMTTLLSGLRDDLKSYFGSPAKKEDVPTGQPAPEAPAAKTVGSGTVSLDPTSIQTLASILGNFMQNSQPAAPAYMGPLKPQAAQMTMTRPINVGK